MVHTLLKRETPSGRPEKRGHERAIVLRLHCRITGRFRAYIINN
jgi:hypothetical protein